MGMFRQRRGNTFRPFHIDDQYDFSQLQFPEFVEKLLEKIRVLKDDGSTYYEGLRRGDSRWANGARSLLALLGTIAFLLTGVAGVLRFLNVGPVVSGPLAGQPLDVWALVGALMIYALIGGISFYERATDKTTGYFRHLGVILMIRDLWTKLQFEVLKELAAFRVAADAKIAELAAREHILSVAEAFCNDFNKITSGELTEWRTDFLASLSELDAAAKKGDEDITKQLQGIAKVAEAAAAEAKTAAKAAEDAAKGGALNLTITGDFDDQIVVLIDEREVARTRLKKFPVDRIPPGRRVVRARAKKGTVELEGVVMIEVKPEVQDIAISLS